MPKPDAAMHRAFFMALIYRENTGGAAMAAGFGQGRTAKPIALRAISNPGKLRTSTDFNVPPLSADNADNWRDALLSTDFEKKLWDLYIAEMQPYKLLAGIDAPMLAALCIEQAIYFEAVKSVKADAAAGFWGRLVAEKGGAYKGAMAVGNKSFDRVMALSAQFGGMPAARVKLAAVSTQLTMDFGDDESPRKRFDEIGYRVIDGGKGGDAS